MRKFRQRKKPVHLFSFEYELTDSNIMRIEIEATNNLNCIYNIKTKYEQNLIPKGDIDNGHLNIIKYDIYPNEYYGFFHNLKIFIKRFFKKKEKLSSPRKNILNNNTRNKKFIMLFEVENDNGIKEKIAITKDTNDIKVAKELAYQEMKESNLKVLNYIQTETVPF